jgi:hypothetical protein
MRNKLLTLATCILLLQTAAFSQNSPTTAKVNAPKKAVKAPVAQQTSKKSVKK